MSKWRVQRREDDAVRSGLQRQEEQEVQKRERQREREARQKEQQRQLMSKWRVQRREDDAVRSEEVDQARNRQLASKKLQAVLQFLDHNFRSKESESAENEWCSPVPDTVKASAILSFWNETLSEDFLPIHYCVICQIKYPRTDLALKVWRCLIPTELDQTFYPRTRCAICFPTDDGAEVLCCTSCSTSLQQYEIPRECQVNQLSIPCEHLYPAELSCLTPVEEKLIAIGISYCFITKFHIDPESQKLTNVNYRKLVKGHITVFSNDVVGVSRILPPSINDVAENTVM